MSITNATNFRKHLFDYLDAAALRDETVLVTTKNGTAAVVSEEYLRTLSKLDGSYQAGSQGADYSGWYASYGGAPQ